MRAQHQSGFILPTVLLVSIVMISIGLSLTQASSSIRQSLTSNYASKLAAEASDAGVVYANYCYTKASRQTWSESTPLTQSTDCNGIVNPAYPTTVQTYNNYRSAFRVGDITTRGDGALMVNVSGTVNEVAAKNTATVVRSFGSSAKQVLNVQTLKASVSSSGTAKTCAIISDELYCWGSNSGGYHGQLGDGTTTDSLTPRKVVQDSGVLLNKVVSKVASAQFHNCALAEGAMYCWGDNSSGQLGASTPAYTSRPIQVKGVLSSKVITAIGASGNTSCAIAEGKIYCWGDNKDGTVGVNSTATTVNTPTLVDSTNLPANYTATAMAVSGSRSSSMCAIVNDAAYCWGNNVAGTIGNGTSGGDVLRPTAVSTSGVLSGKKVTSISQDGYSDGGSLGTYMHVCAVADNNIYCWGENSYGQLGTGNKTDSTVPISPVLTNGLTANTAQDVVVGLRHTCALAASKVYCWGNGDEGVLGNSSWVTSTVPVAVSELAGGLQGKTVTAIGGGANRGCAIADYKSYCWGYNTLGQLGDGTQTNKNYPVRSIFLDPKPQSFLF